MPMGGTMPGAAPAAAAPPEVGAGQGPMQKGFPLVPPRHVARFLSLSLILSLHQPTHPAKLCVLAVGHLQPPWDHLPAEDVQIPAHVETMFLVEGNWR